MCAGLLRRATTAVAVQMTCMPQVGASRQAQLTAHTLLLCVSLGAANLAGHSLHWTVWGRLCHRTQTIGRTWLNLHHSVTFWACSSGHGLRRTCKAPKRPSMLLLRQVVFWATLRPTQRAHRQAALGHSGIATAQRRSTCCTHWQIQLDAQLFCQVRFDPKIERKNLETCVCKPSRASSMYLSMCMQDSVTLHALWHLCGLRCACATMCR
jgi:hypothetical protein